MPLLLLLLLLAAASNERELQQISFPKLSLSKKMKKDSIDDKKTESQRALPTLISSQISVGKGFESPITP